MHELSKSILAIVLIWLVSLSFYGCGGGSMPAPQPPSLATSTISGAGAGPSGYSFTVLCSSITADSIGYSGVPPSWTLTAGAAPMDFTITPTVPWLTLSPASGTLLLRGSTLITVSSLDTSQMATSKNPVGFIASAPGYQDNKSLGLEIAPAGTDSRGNALCLVAYTSDPAGEPLP